MIKKITAVFIAAIFAVISFVIPACAESRYYIKALSANVNVRSGPGTTYEILGKAKYDAKYPCLGTAFSPDGIMWYKIGIDNSEEDGWISSDYAHRFEREIKGDAEPAMIDTSGSKVNEKIQTYLNSVADDYNAIGMQVAVIRASDGKIFNWNYGYATRNTKPMTANTKIRTASISKVAVAMCALKMQEDGLVDLNTDISEYWGREFPKSITLENLFSHTSTLRYLAFKGTMKNTRNQLMDKNSYLDGTPGDPSMWSYNNYAIGVAGSTLELAADETVDEYMKKNFFEPIGIDASFYSGSFSGTPRIATLYEADGGIERTVAEAKAITDAKKPGNNVSIHAGSLTASAKDIAKLFYILSNDGEYGGKRILSEESVSAMEEHLFRTSENGGKFTQCVALRYVKKRYGANELYYHTGNAYGAISMASYNPETGDVVVVMTTGANPKRDKFGVYEICSKITRKMYNNIEKLGN